MKRASCPKVVTASDLLVGDVVYLREDDGWTRDLARAEVVEDEARAQSRLLAAERQKNVIVGAYLADVAPGRHGPEPVHLREAFRRSGPSNYRHGKQQTVRDREDVKECPLTRKSRGIAQ